MGYQWDPKKNDANEAKHGVSFLTAVAIFKNPVLERLDNRRDYHENRFIALGKAYEDVLCVVYTHRNGDIRLISARRASRHEREIYEQATRRSL
jgi:hypothetical protein